MNRLLNIDYVDNGWFKVMSFEMYKKLRKESSK